MILVNLIFLYSPAPNQVPTNSIKCLPNEWINACFLRLGQISFRFSLWINFFDFCFPLLSCIIILNTRISDSMSLAVKRLIKSTKMVTGHYSGNIVPHTDYKTMHSHWTIHKLSWLYSFKWAWDVLLQTCDTSLQPVDFAPLFTFHSEHLFRSMLHVTVTAY